jgi:lipoprotein-anchoring transpeptidase ErfK/SrfK
VAGWQFVCSPLRRRGELTNYILTFGLLFTLPEAALAGRTRPPRPSAGHRVVRSDPAKYLSIQVLLDRTHFSPGEIDGAPGENTRRALRGFQLAHGLEGSGKADPETIRALESTGQGVDTTVSYKVTEDDARGPFNKVPAEMMEQAKLPALGYQSPLEAISEKFHASPKLLTRLNRGKDFSQAGTELIVPNIRDSVPPKAAKVVVSKSTRTVEALDSDGKVIAAYPATIGSEHDPLPVGTWKIARITKNPAFYYNPDLFWDAESSDTKATIQPGPNNPVGVVWIGLSKEHYGIHGTPEPSTVGHVQSHGCIRLTNWDAAELAQIVAPGTPAILKE